MKTAVASILIGIICVGIIGYTLFGENIKNIIYGDADIKQEETMISIPRNIEIPKGETKEIVLPKFWVELSSTSSMTIDDVLEEINVRNEDKQWQEKAYANEDGTITLVLTGRQLDAWLERTEEILEWAIDENSNKMRIVIEENLRSVTYYIKPDCTIEAWTPALALVTTNIIQAQIFSGVSPQEWNIREIVIGEKTGEIIGDMTFPEDSFKIKEDEWNQKIGMENTD